MPILKIKKSYLHTAESATSQNNHASRPGESLAEVQQRLVRAAELMSAKPQREIVKRHAAAALLGVSTRTLQRWHKRKYGPPRSKGKHFHYVRSEIEDWIATHGYGGRRKG
jgi:predicted DNA-binding transcriptional regulator AlpA